VCVGEVREANEDWRCHSCGHYFVVNHGPRGCTFPVLREGIVEQCRCSVSTLEARGNDEDGHVRQITKRERHSRVRRGDM
jgi:hypothetical protein